MNRFQIFIPSKGRADNCKTADFLTELGRDFRIVVEPQEFAAYSEKYPGQVLSLDQNNQGICYVRNWITQKLGPLQQVDSGSAWCWMMDDDISGLAFQNMETKRMYSKKNPSPYTPNELLDWMEAIFRSRDDVALGSGQHVFLAWNSGSDFSLNAACVQMVAFHSERVSGLRYDDSLGLLEDLDMCLQVIRKGYRTCRINRVAPLVPDNGSKEGGLGVYKGTQLEEDAARRVADKWPGVVQTKLDRRGRFGLRVQWWKAAPTPELQIKVKDEGKGPQIWNDATRRLMGVEQAEFLTPQELYDRLSD